MTGEDPTLDVMRSALEVLLDSLLFWDISIATALLHDVISVAAATPAVELARRSSCVRKTGQNA